MLRNEDELQGRINSFLRRKTNQYPELEEPVRLHSEHQKPKTNAHFSPLWNGRPAS